ncbi:MAG TPA: hypothetical protein VNW97_02595 [Candidatus Saccharimonadales bacterium]|jgi:hypothetical protein|nr:hypothetical protein [Candidatus Saccharimonadales bacterium]
MNGTSTERRNARLLGSLRWWNPDRPVASANDWLMGERLKHRVEVASIRLGQWEALRRMGETATTPGEYKEAIRIGLHRQKPGGTPEPRWPEAVLSSLLEEMTSLSKPDTGDTQKELDLQLAKLPAQAQEIRDLIAVERLRAFVDALVTRVKAERALQEEAE